MKKARVIYNMIEHSFDIETKFLGKWQLEERFKLQASAENPEKVFVHFGIISTISHLQKLGYSINVG